MNKKIKSKGHRKGPTVAKTRARSQRIGEEGEALFRLWAVRAGLAPNKTESDYGIDFYCQVFRAAGPAKEEVAGGTVAAAVRTSQKSGDAQYITLDRSDVATLLKHTIPACVIGVDLSNETIHYRFVDIDFADELTTFLGSPRKTVSFSFMKWDSEPKAFVATAVEIGKPGYQHLMRVTLMESEVANEIRGAKIHVRHGAGSGAAIVEVPWLIDAIEIKDADAARRMTFANGHPTLVHGITSLKPVLRKVADLTGGDVFLAGRVAAECRLAVVLGDKRAERRVLGVRFADEIGYRDPATGLVISVSAARRRGPHMVHEFAVESNPGPARLDDEGLREFLLLLQAGARLELDGRPWIDVDHFGDQLTGIAGTVRAIAMIAEKTQARLGDFTLDELLGEEAQRSIGCLEILLNDAATLPELLPGFTFGGAFHEECVEGDPRKADIPLAANIGAIGFVVHVTAHMTPLLMNDEICGFKLAKQEGLRVDVGPRLDTAGTPELWIRDDWPALPLGVEPTADGTLAAIPPRRRPFGLVFAD